MKRRSKRRQNAELRKRRLRSLTNARPCKLQLRWPKAKLKNSNKAKEETATKAKEENELKKTREKKEKDAREVTKKKAQEILRKVTREHADKVSSEKSSKAFTEQQHKERRKKAEEGTQKILEGLKDYAEKLSKARAKYEEKNQAFRKVEPVEKKHKTESANLSKIAKELAVKIKGGEDKDEKNPKTCDLGKNLEKIKKKGLLTVHEGQCEVKCSLKPNTMGMQAQCQLLGSETTGECKKLLYTRLQSVGSALMSEFDAFKKCEIAKKSGAKPEDGGASQYLLGEGRSDARVQRAMPKEVKDGVEVGDYIYSLKDQADISGTVSVPAAMDMLMRCNKDGKGHGSAQNDDMGESYSPDQTEQYNAASGGADGNLASYCKTTTIQQTIDNIAAPAGAGGMEYKCATYGVEAEAYTADCNGGGALGEFLQAAEGYHRNVASTYLTWKSKCVGAAAGGGDDEEQGEELLRLR